jgi:hypothetical protein
LIRPEQLIQLFLQFAPKFTERPINKGLHQLLACMPTSYMHYGALEEA